MIIRLTGIGAALAAAALLASQPAVAQSGTPAGRLTCQVGGALGLVVTSQRPMECRFAPRRGPTQRYLGTVRSFGIDLGTIRAGTMSWLVYGPYARATRRALVGRYVGLAAGAAAGSGASGQVLIGGPDNEIRLQPLALQGTGGVNVAIGVTGFDLAAAGRSR